MKKKITILTALFMLFFLAAITKSNAQAPEWLWATSAGDNSYDEAYSIAYDAHGNCYVAGYYNTFIFDLPHSNGPDAFIAKYGPAGNLTWTSGISDTGRERIYNIAFDKLGNYYILGTFDGPKLELCGNNFINAANNALDIFIAKYDSTHNCIWAKHAGGTDDDTPTGLAVDSLGNAYITGNYNSPSITFGAYPLTNSGGNNSDLFVAKYDPNGTVLWAKSATGTNASTDISKAIAIDQAGNCYITGYFNGDSLTFDAIILVKMINFNMFTARFSPAGTAVWAMRASGTGDSYGNAITVDNESNYYVAGAFKNNITFDTTTLTSAGYKDIFITKYSPGNTVLWAGSAGGPADDEANVLATDNLGYCYLAGNFKSSSINFGSGPLTNNGVDFSDIFITEFTSDGDEVWAKSIGGITNDVPNAIAPDASRDFIIAASLGSTNITIGDTTLYNAGTVDVLVAKSGNTPATGIKETNGVDGISLYPNPAKDYIVIGGVEKMVIEIFDMQGQLCRTLVSTSAETRIIINDLKAGVYFINARNDKFFRTIKLIKI